MNLRRFIWSTVAGVALASGYWVAQSLSSDVVNSSVAIAGDRLAPVNFSLPDLTGKKRELKEWSDKVVVLNFWATWCAPCLEEMPLLIDIQKRYRNRGVQIVGIAIDQQEAVVAYNEKMKINYPILLGEGNMFDLMSRYGNRFASLPYSVILTPKNEIALRKFGAFRDSELERSLNAVLLTNLEEK